VLEVGVPQPQAGGLVAAQVRVDGVGGPNEVFEHRPRFGMPEVERDALLVPVERLEEQRVLALLERRDVPPDIAAGARVLDLDHLGAEIGELQRSPGACTELLDRENADVGERLHARDHRSSSSRPTFRHAPS